MEVRAAAKYVKVSPSKARLVADMLRGRFVTDALGILSVSKKKSAKLIEKVLKTAISNATNNVKHKDPDSLKIKFISIDGGPVAKRQMPRARGTINIIKKRTSHINLILGD